MLAVGMLGDLQIVAYTVLPALLAGVVAMLRQRQWRSGVAQVTAAVASGAAGELLRSLARALGGFEPGPGLPIAHLDQMLTNLRHVLTYGAESRGADERACTAPAGSRWRFREVHVLGALCIVTCILAALTSLVAGAIRGRPHDRVAAGEPELWRLDDMLVVAVFSLGLPFVVLAQANGAGDPLPRRERRDRQRADRSHGGQGVALAPEGLGGPGGRSPRDGGVVELRGRARLRPGRPCSTNPAPAMAAWLEAHDLRNGIGEYWAASITTVESSGAVTVRPVSSGADGKLQRTMNQSSASWYEGQQFQFLVYVTPQFDHVDLESTTRTWGDPAHLYVVGRYRVLVWRRPVTVVPFPPGTAG